MYNWHKIEFPVTDLPDGQIKELEVSGKRIGILRKAGALHAFAALCPHAGAPLCEGWLDAMGRIVCPMHKYRFDPANGRNTSGEGYKLFTYPLQEREDGWYVGYAPLPLL